MRTEATIIGTLIDEGDGTYFLNRDGRLYRQKKVLKLIKPFLENGKPYVYLFDGHGKRKHTSINKLLNDYWPKEPNKH